MIRGYVPWAFLAGFAAYFWMHSIAFAALVFCVTMALARD